MPSANKAHSSVITFDALTDNQRFQLMGLFAKQQVSLTIHILPVQNRAHKTEDYISTSFTLYKHFPTKREIQIMESLNLQSARFSVYDDTGRPAGPSLEWSVTRLTTLSDWLDIAGRLIMGNLSKPNHH